MRGGSTRSNTIRGRRGDRGGSTPVGYHPRRHGGRGGSQDLPKPATWLIGITATDAIERPTNKQQIRAIAFGIWNAAASRMTMPLREPFQNDETGAIIGAGIQVHRIMGRGFLEPVYPECLAIEFQRRGIPFVREAVLPVWYDGIPLPVHYRVDFICYDAVLVEVKALSAIGPREAAQVMNYLRASRLQRALLLNFGADKLETRRFVWDLANDPLNPSPAHSD